MSDKLMCTQNFDAKFEMAKQSRWTSEAMTKVYKKKKHLLACIRENGGISELITVTDCSHWCEISRVRNENPQRDGESKRNYEVIECTIAPLLTCCRKQPTVLANARFIQFSLSNGIFSNRGYYAIRWYVAW